MKSILIGLGVIVILALGWLLFFDNSNEFEVLVDQELSTLEEELVALEGQVAAGTLTSQQATAAQTQISQQLASISASVPTDASVELNEEQRSALRDGLERLKNMIVEYQNTLVAIDETAGGGGQSVVETAIGAVEEIQTRLEEVADGLVVEDINIFLADMSSATNALEAGATTTATSTTTTTATTTDIEIEEATTTPEDKGPIINPDLEATTSVETAT